MFIKVEHHHYIHWDDEDTKKSLQLIHHKLDKIMSKEQEALDGLNAIQAQLTKIGTETSTSLTKITELETLAQENNVPQSVLDKIAEVKAQAQVVDDLVPDAPVAQP